MSKNTFFSNPTTILCKGELIDLSYPKIMGVINLTPDSFYADSRKQTYAEILTQAAKMLADGADFLDLGAYSTRPGAEHISPEEEKKRLIPVVQLLMKEFPAARLSVDTFRAEIAQEAIDCGACMINDVSGGRLDNKMFDTVAKLNVPYILMHSRGNPQTMQNLTHYTDVVLNIVDEMLDSIQTLRCKGVKDIILDPGFGFAKNIAQNFELLRRLKELHVMNLPILVGVSRKSMIYKSLQISPEEALNGSSVLHAIALQNGASILRVHDVPEAKQCIQLVSLIHKKN